MTNSNNIPIVLVPMIIKFQKSVSKDVALELRTKWEKAYGIEVTHVYSAVMNGFAARVPQSTVHEFQTELMKQSPYIVAKFETDHVVSAFNETAVIV